jgi:1,4-dihydroxy-2-naphthoate polyprenyltransferase
MQVQFQSKAQAWLYAARLRTLPLALSSIALGSFLAASDGVFELKVLLWAGLTTIFLQVLSNLANDYGDAVSGVDSLHREGPSRAVQSGAISKEAMKRAMVLFGILSFLSGIILLYVSLGFETGAFLFFLLLGLGAIAAAVAYTAGKKPYGYVGLGDVSVFLFFGIVGVVGTYYLHAQTIDWSYLLPAASCGLFSTAVLNVNNIRDIKSDLQAGKKSVPVRIGRANAVNYHWVLLVGGLLCSFIFVLIAFEGISRFMFLLSLPLIIKNGLAVSKFEKPSELDPYLKQMAMATLFYVLTFGLGILGAARGLF